LLLGFPKAGYWVCLLLGDAPQTQLILMDDGFQHLAIEAGFNIVLTDYHNLFTQDWLLPSGTLREFPSAYKRAQCIVVTKCPDRMSKQQQSDIRNNINPLPHQQLLFSKINYHPLISVFSANNLHPQNPTEVLCFTGIANNSPLIEYLKTKYSKVQTVTYSDHKQYDALILSDIVQRFRLLTNAIIITTEKDAVKLQTEAAQNILGDLPLFYQPVGIAFYDDGGNSLLHNIVNYINTEQAKQLN
jgi:tetraacyldisaccharide 4'-kinase